MFVPVELSHCCSLHGSLRLNFNKGLSAFFYPQKSVVPLRTCYPFTHANSHFVSNRSFSPSPILPPQEFCHSLSSIRPIQIHHILLPQLNHCPLRHPLCSHSFPIGSPRCSPHLSRISIFNHHFAQNTFSVLPFSFLFFVAGCFSLHARPRIPVLSSLS